MSELVEYVVPRNTTFEHGDFSVMDSICILCTQLHDLGLRYEEDWCLHSSGYRPGTQERLIILEFYESTDAFLVKLKGATKLG